jgi:hypothetical protein
MEERRVSLRISEVGFIAGTRVALGAGIGLILADKLNDGQRKRAGRTLLAIGVLTTIPLLVNLIRRARQPMEIGA